MKKILVLAALALAAPSFAATTQQNKMKECNAQAKGKKGDERKAFMKECLSSEAAAAVAAPAVPAAPEKSADPKQRMKDCNTQAKGKKGDERKTFMSSCLKSDAPAKM